MGTQRRGGQTARKQALGKTSAVSTALPFGNCPIWIVERVGLRVCFAVKIGTVSSPLLLEIGQNQQQEASKKQNHASWRHQIFYDCVAGEALPRRG